MIRYPHAQVLATLAVCAVALAGCGDQDTPQRPAGAADGGGSSVAERPHRAAPGSRGPVEEPEPVAPLAGRTIGIDPGHNGRNRHAPEKIGKQVWDGRTYKDCNTTGTSTQNGYAESRFTFEVASRLAERVREAGGKVVLTRTSDDGVGPCVDVRAQTLNEAGADVAIDIHADGGPAWGRGFTILRPVPSGVNDAIVAESHAYADHLKAAMLETGMPVADYYGTDGFEDRSDLAGLNLSTVPQLLLEAGNMRNSEDAALLTSDRFQRSVAEAILDAMVAHLATKGSARDRPGR